jgi:cytochrome P450
VKDTWTFGLLRSVLGDGLLTSDGEAWRCQRRIVQPAFHRALLESLASIVLDETDAMLARWRGTIDLGAEMSRLTLAIVTRAILGVTMDLGEVSQHLTAVLEHLYERTTRAFDLRPGPRERRFRAHVDALDAVVGRIIDARRRGKRSAADLVGLLLQADLDDRAIRDQVMTFLLAGHETTANLLVWMLATLGGREQEHVLARVRDEVGSARLCFETLKRLSYMRMVLDETMRLYPPLWLLERRAVKADVLTGVAVPEGASIAIATYAMHRAPMLWPEPKLFNPMRFAPGVERAAHAFIPFGAGARACIGEAFARMETLLVVARIVQSVDLGLLDAAPLRPAAFASLRPASPIDLAVRARPSLQAVLA